MPSRGELIDLAHQWVALWRPGADRAEFDRLHAPNFIDRSAACRMPDRDGFRQGIIDLLQAFPDFHAVVDDCVADEQSQSVTVRWSATGTHARPYLGRPPTHRTIRFQGIEIIRIRANQITERWGEWNGQELLDQLQRD